MKEEIKIKLKKLDDLITVDFTRVVEKEKATQQNKYDKHLDNLRKEIVQMRKVGEEITKQGNTYLEEVKIAREKGEAEVDSVTPKLEKALQVVNSLNDGIMKVVVNWGKPGREMNIVADLTSMTGNLS